MRTAFYPVRLVTRLLHDFSLRRFKKILRGQEPDLVVGTSDVPTRTFICSHVARKKY